ncbi:MAG TPA: trigger factor, partial [Candidatus Binataceae bacterium]|nr:trigger factor [Candidatus Binataceae bacterium]
MQVNIESPSALRRKVTIEVEPDEIKRELDHSYNELRRGVMLKGFRPGRAPRNMLERLFGDQVRGEVIQKLVKEYTEKALDENALKPIVAPEIITEETDLTKSLKFSAVFDLKPELVVKDYEGLKVPESRIEVGDKDVDEAIGVMRERQATLKKIEDRTVVREGDVVLASIEAFEGDKAVTALKAEDRMLRVSRESLAHGLEEVLIGAETGKLARGVKSYGADYSQADLAGKSIEWRITVKEIFQREVPELDDEFAKDNDFTSVEALKKRVRADLESQARAEADARARQGLL